MSWVSNRLRDLDNCCFIHNPVSCPGLKTAAAFRQRKIERKLNAADNRQVLTVDSCSCNLKFIRNLTAGLTFSFHWFWPAVAMRSCRRLHQRNGKQTSGIIILITKRPAWIKFYWCWTYRGFKEEEETHEWSSIKIEMYRPDKTWEWTRDRMSFVRSFLDSSSPEPSISWLAPHESRTDSSQSWVWWCTKGKGKVNRCIIKDKTRKCSG